MDNLLFLQISESRMEEIRKIIVEMLRASGAKCGLLIDASGHLLVRKGFTLLREIENLCVLISASRATTRAIAQILGQEEISVIFHQGAGEHIHSTDVGDQAIMTLVFDDRADLARLQRVAREGARRIAPLLAAEADPGKTANLNVENLGSEADKKLDELFAVGDVDEDDPQSSTDQGAA